MYSSNFKYTFYKTEWSNCIALDNLDNAYPYDWLHQKSVENEMYFFWKIVLGF